MIQTIQDSEFFSTKLIGFVKCPDSVGFILHYYILPLKRKKPNITIYVTTCSKTALFSLSSQVELNVRFSWLHMVPSFFSSMKLIVVNRALFAERFSFKPRAFPNLLWPIINMNIGGPSHKG